MLRCSTKAKSGFTIPVKKSGLGGSRLVFNKKAADGAGTCINNGTGTGTGTAYANICYSGSGFRCPFAAYRITMDQLSILDGYEGVPNHYVRIGLPFTDTHGESFMGHIYLGATGQIVAARNPSQQYLNHILDGYREHGFKTDSLDEFNQLVDKFICTQ